MEKTPAKKSIKGWFKKRIEKFQNKIENWAEIPPLVNQDPEQVAPTPTVKEPVTFGVMVLIVFVGGFLLWASLAPLDTAAVAPGKIVVDSNRKTIQHLEGGIVKKIFVTEGSVVKAGDPLVELDETQAAAKLQLLQGQKDALLAQEARLIAERDMADKINFPEELLKQANNPEIAKIIQGEQSIFDAHNKNYKDNIDILNERIEQLKSEILSIRSQAKSYDGQLKLINEETAAVAILLAKKYIDKPRYLALKREAARLTGNRDEQLALAARTEQRIGETQIQIITLKSDRQNKIVEELQKTQNDLADTEEKLKSAADISHRTLIIAPRSGTVVNLNVHTIGGIVSPGQAILDLVPNDDPLIIEARINPLDIDAVHAGLMARVRLTAFKQRRTPTLDGEVTQVSADNMKDEKTGESYYSARVSISPEELKRLKDEKLYPGMPAQVLIVTETHTPLQYFITPIEDSFSRAFHEQ